MSRDSHARNAAFGVTAGSFNAVAQEGGRAIDPRDSAARPSSARSLSPGAVDFLNAIANLGVASHDPWAKYPPVLGVEHVAEIPGVQAPAVSEAARRGSLPMTKVCGKWKIDQIEFRRLCGYRGSDPAARAG